jgi:hypothetical protein
MSKILCSLLLLGGSLSPTCCWVDIDDVALHDNQLNLNLSSSKFCLSGAQYETGALQASTTIPGWGITNVSLVATLDGQEVPPPSEIYSSTSPSSNVTTSGASGNFSSSVQDVLTNAEGDGNRHLYGVRVIITMTDDQGNTQVKKVSTVAG